MGTVTRFSDMTSSPKHVLRQAEAPWKQGALPIRYTLAFGAHSVYQQRTLPRFFRACAPHFSKSYPVPCAGVHADTYQRYWCLPVLWHV